MRRVLHKLVTLCAGRNGRSAVLGHESIDGFQLLNERVVVDWDADGRNAAETSPFVMIIMAICANAIWCSVLCERARDESWCGTSETRTHQ